MCSKPSPNARAVMENLRKPMPFGKKAVLVLKNSFLKIVRLKSCCGHPGEPGC